MKWTRGGSSFSPHHLSLHTRKTHFSSPRSSPRKQSCPVLLAPVLAVLLVLSLILSCAGQEERKAEGNREKTEGPAGESGTQNIGTAVETEAAGMMWNTFPRGGNPIFFASANRKYDREEERQEALQNGAEQASRYVELLGKAFFLKQKTNTEIGYLQDIQISFDESLAGKLTEKVTPLKEHRDNRNTYLLLELDSPIPGPGLPITPEEVLRKDGRGVPQWISSPPKLPGFLVGVGAAQRKFRFPDSITAADEKALEELLAQVSSRIKALHREHSIDRFGTFQETTSLQTTEAKINGFYILSRWTDGQYFYSLGICNPNRP